MRPIKRFCLAVMTALALICVVASLASAARAATPLQPPPLVAQQPGTYIYDEAGKLSAAQIADLQQRAQKLANAGANPVVYLQKYAPATGETAQEASNLGESWRLGPRGVIIFLNLNPSDTNKGSGVLDIGTYYRNSGVITNGVAQNIYSQQMVPRFRQGDFAGGLATGLDAVYQRIQNGGGTSVGTGGNGSANGGNSTGTAVSAPGPNPLGVLLGLGLIPWLIYTWRRATRPLHAGYSQHPAGTMPDDLPASLVGALIHGTAREKDVRASILEMGTVDAVSVIPTDDRTLELRLGDKARIAEPWQLMAYESLADAADKAGVVSATALSHAAGDWQPIYDVIEAALRERGLRLPPGERLIPKAGHANRLYAIAGAALAFVGLIASQIAAIAGVWFLLFVAGIALFAWGASHLYHATQTSQQRRDFPPGLTERGALACAAWRDYADRVNTNRIAPLDPTRLTIYAPVLDVEEHVLPWLITSARMGFVPAWLSEGLTTARNTGVTPSPFYVYWLAFLQGYVDPALITPEPAPPQLQQQPLSHAEFWQPVGGYAPAPVNALPFIFPVGYPLYTPPVIIEQPVPVGGDNDGWQGGGSDWQGGAGDWQGGGNDSGGNDWGGGGGDFGGGGGDFGGGGGDF